ncbi:PAS domain-containing protein [Desulfatiglans anilini]|uniref:PAS domain-containing protein n=1 Tax=Desulfatiglans anilini TaxID=90728 RepID=UPI000400C971|nr:PAS domain-containing protein [Desulfatiglans anilini]
MTVHALFPNALIVDNDYFFVRFLVDQLHERGYTADRAYDGKEGIARLQDGFFSLVFCDIIMPKIDGRAVIAYIRRHCPVQPKAVVAVSGLFVELTDQLDGIEADYFMAKGPLEQMSEQVQRLLGYIETGGRPPPRFFFEPEERDEAAGFNQPAVELMEVLKGERSILESLAMGVVVVDKDARVLSANPPALELFGLPAAEIVNRHIASLFAEESRGALIGAMRSALLDRSHRKVELSGSSGGGSRPWAVSAWEAQGEVMGWVLCG